MSLIKSKKIGNTTIEIYDDCIPKDKEELKKNIKNLYNVINRIASKLTDEQIKEMDLFYTNEELKNVEII